MPWQQKGNGAYNVVFYNDSTVQLVAKSSHTGPWALKTPIVSDEIDEEISEPTRVVKILHEIYPLIPAAVYSTKQDALFPTDIRDHKKSPVKIATTGWIMPFIPKKTSSKDDKAIAHEILQIYIRSRRLILDGCGHDNFKKDSKGNIYCVDYDLARRRGSNVSDSLFQTHEIYEQYKKYWEYYKVRRPLSTKMIRALLLLEYWLEPENIKNEFLTYEVLIKFDYDKPTDLIISENILKVMNIIYSIDPDLLTSHMCNRLYNAEFDLNSIINLSMEQNKLKIKTTYLWLTKYFIREMITKCFGLQELIKLYDYAQRGDVIGEDNIFAINYLVFVDSRLVSANYCIKLFADASLGEWIRKTSTDADALSARDYICMFDPSKTKLINNLDCETKKDNFIDVLFWLEQNIPELTTELEQDFLDRLSPLINMSQAISENIFLALKMIHQTNPNFLTHANCHKLSSDPNFAAKIINTSLDGTLSSHTCIMLMGLMEPDKINIYKDIIKIDPSLKLEALNNEYVYKALSAANQYLTSGKFGFWSSHGRHGQEQTKKFIKKIISLNNPSREDVKAEMKIWLAGNKSKLQGWLTGERTSNANIFSRSRFVYDSGVFDHQQNSSFASCDLEERKSLLNSMLISG